MSEAVKGYRVWWDDEAKVARVAWLPGSVCGLAEAKGVTDALLALGRGRVPAYVNAEGITKLERPARQHLVSEQGGVRAIAVFAVSPVAKMLANFFIGMRRMPVPIQMFTNEAEALTWLHGFSE